MGKHLGKRERAAGKRKKRSRVTLDSSSQNGSGSLTLKLGSRKLNKLNYYKLGIPF